MTTIAQIGGQFARAELHNERVLDFVNVARCLMLGKSLAGAVEIAKERKSFPRIIDILERAVVAPGTSSGWGSQLAPFQPMADAWLASLRNVGLFDAILPSCKNLPMRASVVVSTVGAVGVPVPEASLKSISRLTLANSQLQELKAVTILVATADLLQIGGATATRLFETELQGATASATDTAFLNEVSVGAPAFSTSGLASTAIASDIKQAIDQLSPGAQSKIFLAVDAATARYWTFVMAGGLRAFPDMGVNGGTIGGVQVVVTDAAAGKIYAIDAAKIAANGGTLELDSANAATIQLADGATLDSPPLATTTLHSFFQENLVGLRCTRIFAAENLGNAVAIVSNTANSPA